MRIAGIAAFAFLAVPSVAVARDATVWTAQEISALSETLTAEAARAPGGGAGRQLRDEPGYRLALNVNFRSGGPEQHDGWTDEIRVMTGEVDLVTGGTLEDRHAGKAEGEYRGSALTGTTVTRRLHAGDIAEVPAGTPHWSKVVTAPATTLVYKVR